MPLVTDVLLIDYDSGSKCPEGFDSLETPFPGIREGCLCTNIAAFPEVSGIVCSDDMLVGS
jgi:hypothetical protein